MIYRKLGSSGLDASVIGFGAWAIGGWMWGGTDERKAIDGIHAAIDQGINLIDTAPVYGFGRSEEIVGRAIRDRRQKVLVATKCGLIWDREEGEFFFNADEKGATPGPAKSKIYRFLGPASIRAEVEQSLRRLQTDHLDLLQTHWQESVTPLEDTVAALVKLKEEGKIRAIGVSNVHLDHLRAYGPIDSDQERFSLLDRKIAQAGLLDYCREHAIAVLAYSPLANGLLTGKLSPERKFGEGDLRRNNPRFSPESVRRVNTALEQLRPIADRHQATVGQVVIAWTSAQPGVTCVLCGARDPAQAVENARAAEIRLSPEDLAAIDGVGASLAGI
jgi:methylglyoxal reductase